MGLWQVSILVLLDDAYRHCSGRAETALLASFQSLFFWMMPTGPMPIFMDYTPLTGFQSLFFWMMPTGLVPTRDKTEAFKFQSLFFWMMPTGSLSIPFLIFAKAVSILVLLDDAYRPNFLSILREKSRGFQSLFFWMMPTGLLRLKIL